MGDWKEMLLGVLAQTWRRRWIALGVAWIVCVVGWALVAAIPDTYQSRTRIYVDTESMLSPLMHGITVETNLSRQVEVVQRTLLSRPNIEKVLRATDLDITATTAESREALIQSIEKRTSIRAEAARNLFSIEFSDRNPGTARRVLQEFLNIFIESNVGSQRKDIEKAQTFIAGQITFYGQQLSEAEARIAEFKERHRDTLPAALGGEGGFAGNLARARELLTGLKRELDEATVRRAALSRQLAAVPRILEVSQRGGFAEGRPNNGNINQRIGEAETNLNQLLTRFTEKHPDVIAARRTLDQLRKQRDETPQDDGGGSSIERVSNPVYEQLQIKVADAETTVELLQRRYNDQKSAVDRLEAMAQTIPQVEMEYNNLTRDQGILKKTYSELLDRRESARLSQEIDTKADKVEFRVVEPPYLPVAPSFPNRTLLCSGVLLLAVGAGIAFAYAMAQFDDSIASVRQLRSVLPYPVIGAVSMLSTADRLRSRKRSLLMFATACSMLLLAYGGMTLAAVRGFGPEQLAQYRHLLKVDL